MVTNKRIVISGASGFIGGALSSFLASGNNEIIPLGREMFKPESAESLCAVVSNADVVINLAGAPILNRWTKKYKKELLDSRVRTTRSLVQAIHISQSKPSVFISASAVGYYTTPGCFNEYNGVEGHSYLSTICGAWEKEALLISPEIRTAITRFGIVLSKDGGAFPKMAFSSKLGVKSVIGSGKQPFSWIALQDLQKAMAFIMADETLTGVFNFTVPEQISFKDFADECARHYRNKISIPIPAGLIQLFLGEASGFLLNTPCAMPTRLEEAGFQFSVPTLRSFIG